MGELVVITGLSGAGRSEAADDLEDLGWFVIDNLPAALIPKVVELAKAPGSTIERLALVVGAGGPGGTVHDALASLRASGERVRQVFLEARTDVLVRRYESSRRRHPLLVEGEGLAESIERERTLLAPVKAESDLVVDTSELNVHQLHDRIVELFGEDRAEAGMLTRIVSFGYKHGLPTDVDLVLDCRFLPNPYWVDELRPLTGLDASVRAHVLDRDAARDFLDRLGPLLELLLPAYRAEGKAYLTIAFGCTGGRHRSVAIAEEVASRLRGQGAALTTIHRDIDR